MLDALLVYTLRCPIESTPTPRHSSASKCETTPYRRSILQNKHLELLAARPRNEFAMGPASREPLQSLRQLLKRDGALDGGIYISGFVETH